MFPFVRCLLPACIAVAPVAQAAIYTVHVCEDGRGGHIYQDAPCEVGTRTVGMRAYAIATPDPVMAARTRAAEAEMDRRNRGDGHARIVRTRYAARPAAADSCRTAKDRRESELKRVGLKRTFDQLSTLDREVWDACHGF